MILTRMASVLEAEKWILMEISVIHKRASSVLGSYFLPDSPMWTVHDYVEKNV